MIGSINPLNDRQFATSEALQKVFMQNQPELEWFAYVITGSEKIAAACVVDAGTMSVAQNQVFEDWLLDWVRFATIRSAIQAQRERRMLRVPASWRSLCAHVSHEPLDPSTIEFIENYAELLIKRLGPLSRVALVVHGMQKHSLGEAAILAGVPVRVMREAFCAALQTLDVLQCEQITAKDNSEPLYN